MSDTSSSHVGASEAVASQFVPGQDPQISGLDHQACPASALQAYPGPQKPALQIVGCHSSAGKTALVTGLCRLLRRRGYRVAPFKSQNMSSNVYRDPKGFQISASVAMQALGAGVPPEPAMNPILLRPSSLKSSEVFLMGQPYEDLAGHAYFQAKKKFWPTVLEAFHHLEETYDFIVVEGAGSPAEVNLSIYDYVNLGLAKALDIPAILVGDIDRGGVFASLYGTMQILPPDLSACLRGWVINKFRGDPSLLEPGLSEFAARVGKPHLGTIPYSSLHLDEEDSLNLDLLTGPEGASSPDQGPELASSAIPPLEVRILSFPGIQNFSTLGALTRFPHCHSLYVTLDQLLAHGKEAGKKPYKEASKAPDLIVVPEVDLVRSGVPESLNRLVGFLSDFPCDLCLLGTTQSWAQNEAPELWARAQKSLGLGQGQGADSGSSAVQEGTEAFYWELTKTLWLTKYPHLASQAASHLFLSSNPRSTLDEAIDQWADVLEESLAWESLIDLAQARVGKESIQREAPPQRHVVPLQQMSPQRHIYPAPVSSSRRCLMEGNNNTNDLPATNVQAGQAIEDESFQRIRRELGEIVFPEALAPIILRVIHTTADFDYAHTMRFYQDPVAKAHQALAQGATIFTDTTMALSGLNKRRLATWKGEAHCYVGDPETKTLAQTKAITRSAASVLRVQEWAKAHPTTPFFYVVGNAPTALLALCEAIEEGSLRPALVVAVPVGFVNVIEGKAAIAACCAAHQIPCILNEGRKGGSNVAAAILNALLYSMPNPTEENLSPSKLQ